MRNISRLNIPCNLSEFRDILVALRKLYHVCNDDYLCANYAKVIDDFSRAWYKLRVNHDISTTPKIHIILDHLCDYFDDSEMTLKCITDELVENMHQHVEKIMMRSGYKVKDVSNPNHGTKLFKAVMHVNSYNLKIK